MYSLSPAREVGRVRDHLFGAEMLARSNRAGGLDPAQRLTRALLLDELARYREAGVFPKNHDSALPRPAFIDEHGTRCAMAHLMELGGAAEVVAEIARENNHAYVEELARDARVIAWLRAAGLTVEEAARIQPTYCVSAAQCVCVEETTGIWEGTVVEPPEASPASHARVDVVHRPFGAQVGDVVGVGGRPPVGARILAAGDRTIALIDDAGALGSMCFASRSEPTPIPPITKAHALEVIMDGGIVGSACVRALEAENVAWSYGCGFPQADAGATPDASVDASTDGRAEGTVDGGALAGPNDDGGGGCSLSAASSPESVSVLLAVLSALAVRRSVRRR